MDDKPRIVVLGAGARSLHIAALLAAVAEVQVVEPGRTLRWDHEYPTLTLNAPNERDLFPMARQPGKEKAQWKRERQGRK